MTIGDQILIARKRAGLTQAELGERIGVHPTGIVEIEKDRIGISPAMLDRIMAVCREAAMPESAKPGMVASGMD